MVTMNIVCVDDSDAKTSVQTAKILKRFLFKIGNRTYRGSLTPAKFQKLRNELNSVDRAKPPKIYFYYTIKDKDLREEVIGDSIANYFVI